MALDYAVYYESIKKKTIQGIANVMLLGVDVSKLMDAVNEIDESINEKMDNKGFQSCKLSNCEEVYRDAIRMLNNIDNRLDKYNLYFKLMKSCDWIEIKIKNDVSLEELKQYVGEMFLNLKAIVKSGTIKFDYEEAVVNKVYKVTYDLIKLELLLTGDSQLYHYAVLEDINIAYLNNLVREDISKIDIVDSIKEKLLQIERNGINCNYFNMDLIKKIVYFENKQKFNDIIAAKSDSLAEKIMENEELIAKQIQEFNLDREQISLSKNNNKKQIKKFDHNIILFILSASLSIAGGFGVYKASKWLASEKYYNLETEIYSSLDDSSSRTIEESIRGNYKDGDNTVLIRKYIDGQRSYLEYDVSKNEVKFDTAKEYYDYGIDNFGVEPKLKKNDDLVDFTLPECIEVIKTDYKYLSTAVNTSYFYFISILLFVGYVFFLLGIDFEVTDSKTEIGFLFSSLRKIVGTAINCLDDKKKIRECSKRISDIINEIMPIINEDQMLREEYNKLCDENKYLLDNPELLIRKINEACYNIEDIKKLAKRK